ncbi:conoCAP-like [Pecten maximus]|uniref:conoCAP-like n=1 Tax=Pecten maximus TaxID=6579 RepID=UPI0014581384|nr:conoCAP-like [Pecten maximus]XP_033757469.1 conoCAP-like [Pecten maximus]
MMEPSTLNMLCQTVLLTLMLALTCNAGRSLDVDEALKQILSENNDETYYPSDSTDLDTSDRAVSDLIRRLQPGSDDINKRVFCNGFRGCRGRGRKRTMAMKQQRILPEEPPVQKRPFCNGFFGCANGKRSSIRVPSRQQIPDKNELETVQLPKRLFCNTYGCLNGKRSSLYNTLMSKLRSDNLDQVDPNLQERL